MATLETERLVLRIPVMADFDAFAAMWADESVNKHITGKTWSRKESWGKFCGNVGAWALKGYGQWSVVHKETDSYLGQVGFFDADRGIGDDFDKDREAGWVFMPKAHGQGYATEAMQAALNWFDAQEFGDRIVCMMDADYAATWRVAQKCGFSEMRRTSDEHGDVLLMERLV